ncbi:hypothetical protein COPEUT_01260, partial [Coprococcus eutactus ATCC 27759]
PILVLECPVNYNGLYKLIIIISFCMKFSRYILNIY